MNQQNNGARDADFDDQYGDFGFVSHRDPGLGIFNVNFIRVNHFFYVIAKNKNYLCIE